MTAAQHAAQKALVLASVKSGKGRDHASGRAHGQGTRS